ncbi:hypothetical protein TNCT_570981 [Trichonephila clavata]|uniref:Uncharacterized protein n=1 Tax=Trichonephila clavata TaxID=2740835 RepID=A0A8X6G1B4_TRICU|nr:hypothetical protein TNCT_570981 [Trichonephila clavata]
MASHRKLLQSKPYTNESQPPYLYPSWKSKSSLKETYPVQGYFCRKQRLREKSRPLISLMDSAIHVPLLLFQ